MRPKWVERVVLHHRLKVELLEQLEAPLARAGRHDLVRAIRRRARRFQREQTFQRARGWLRGMYALSPGRALR